MFQNNNFFTICGNSQSLKFMQTLRYEWKYSTKANSRSIHASGYVYIIVSIMDFQINTELFVHFIKTLNSIENGKCTIFTAMHIIQMESISMHIFDA